MEAPHRIDLYGYDLDPGHLSHFAQGLNGQECIILNDGDPLPSPEAAAEIQHRVVIFNQPTQERLRRVMKGGFSGCCEADCTLETIRVLCDSLSSPPAWGFFLCLSTQTAYQLNLAALLVEILGTHIQDESRDWILIETVLQEALSNAIIHGNLGIESHTRGDLEGFATFSQALNLRLQDPQFSRRSISIRAWVEPPTEFGVEIRDQGNGYNPSQAKTADDQNAYGRGIDIIQSCVESVAHFDEGRGIRITFASAQEQSSSEASASLMKVTRPLPDPGLNLATLETPILVVDDDFVARELITSYLSGAGFKTIDTAENGLQALEKIQNNPPGLLILDIVMPEMNGLELCRRLRCDDEHRRLPVLVQTAHDQADDRRKIFAAGATDLVFKPIHAEELVARVRIHIENMLLVRGMRRYQERVAHELSFAQRMQFDMLPGTEDLEEIHQRYGVRIASHFAPSSELGGDFWGAFGISKNTLGIYVVDFTGHGVMSALNTVRLHTMVREIPLVLSDPVAFTEEVNARLTDLLPVGQFATIVYGTLDIEKDLFTYAAAAAPNPIAGSRQSPIKAYDGAGMPLGISKTAKYPKREISVSPGGFVLLYSDALIESVDSSGAMFGDERLLKLVHETRDAAGDEPFLDDLLTRFKSMVNTPLDDDLTAVCLMRGGR